MWKNIPLGNRQAVSATKTLARLRRGILNSFLRTLRVFFFSSPSAFVSSGRTFTKFKKGKFLLSITNSTYSMQEGKCSDLKPTTRVNRAKEKNHATRCSVIVKKIITGSLWCREDLIHSSNFRPIQFQNKVLTTFHLIFMVFATSIYQVWVWILLKLPSSTLGPIELKSSDVSLATVIFKPYGSDLCPTNCFLIWSDNLIGFIQFFLTISHKISNLLWNLIMYLLTIWYNILI